LDIGVVRRRDREMDRQTDRRSDCGQIEGGKER
jgi:hypothetical protein